MVPFTLGDRATQTESLPGCQRKVIRHLDRLNPGHQRSDRHSAFGRMELNARAIIAAA
jgi:hypothetical protein